MTNPEVIIIGSGPSGLMAAQRLAEKGVTVHIYEQNKAAARKFLVAGHGGFNITHSQDIEKFILNYDKKFIQHIVQQFNNSQTILWLKSIGIPTYIGSSGKIFPQKNIKPIDVLNAWLNKLQNLGVVIHYGYEFIDFNHHEITLKHASDHIILKYNKLIFALGGASWKKTGSTATWKDIFDKKDIKLIPFSAANSGYETEIDFSEIQGQVLKNIEVSFNDIKKKGELVFTSYGIEGSAIYYLNRFTRKHTFPQTINIDLKPNKKNEEILELLYTARKTTEVLKQKLKLNKAALFLLKKINKDAYNTPTELIKYIKSFPIIIHNFRPINEVISTAGGLSLDELNNDLSLKKYPSVYCIGEMLDWEAPTGGYLLQACFSMGVYCAENLYKLHANKLLPNK